MEIFLSPFRICTRDQDWRASGRRCINEFCKSVYIIYRTTGGTARRRSIDDGHVAVAMSKARTNRNLARFPGPIGQCVCHLKNSLSIASRGARRPETFPKTAIYCHLLPFCSRKTAMPVRIVSILSLVTGHFPLALGSDSPRRNRSSFHSPQSLWSARAHT